MPIDVNLLKLTPQLVRNSQAKRFVEDTALVDKCLAWYKLWTHNKSLLDSARKEKNTLNKVIGQKKKAKEDAEEEVIQSKALTAEIGVKEQLTAYLEKVSQEEIHKLGNIILDSVPVSNDEADNLIVGTHQSEVKPTCPTIHSHHTLLYMIGGYEPERGVKTAGHRGYFLTGVAVSLCQALSMYAMDFLQSRNFTKVMPPYFMTKEAMAKVAELNDFDEQLYHVSTDSKAADKYLIATSEQPLCYYHVGEILNPKELPLKYAAFSTNFRKEAGKHGKDTWGIFRVHQFDKIEQFIVTHPDESENEHEKLRQNSEDFLQSLGLSYQVVSIVSGALNDAAAKKYDIEGYFPGYGEHKELVSCSNCLDYQSRALGIRYAKGEYVHMLNSTLCAVTRVVCCILETYQTETGVKVPEPLVKFVGTDFMPFVRKPNKEMTSAK